MRGNPKISVACANILDFDCDILILKYAQWWHGADLTVATKLDVGKRWDVGGNFVAPGDFRLINAENKLGADHVLFEGVPELRELNYKSIRLFAKSAIMHVHESVPDARHIAMTVHGVNIGMDERESFLAQLAGVWEAMANQAVLPKIEKISFVEKNKARAGRLAKLLDENFFPRASVNEEQISPSISQAGSTKEKAHIFVAMPFTPEMEDVYIFGIQGPIQEAGFLCERVDQAVFTGDIVERIKSRIETAKMVIADLTGANANVYLEVGYAWGKNVDALLLCRNIEDLRFDVKGQRCLAYSSISDLNKKLSAELKVLAAKT